ncbi:FlgM family anti-sigma-28 factor [Melghiribacillus thermohalophilus]|uniref:Negative regulator of flagellin synthesis n=1 Tax=Melghiribacillus thermohalophilus TaxID=1324956 RepID=A0A4R3MVT8_9BACI|nr:flagellar biosynthesis anti-sigma factor FlgM [Melghiribacillus thermohalophilus]TCT20454.1 FlgM family anti-sigma-28 factor [Melghiribacillus thermohalophilus]
MKIQGPNHLNLNPYQKPYQQQAKMGKGKTSEDKVEISSEAKKMLETNPIADERKKKVEKLTEQVQSGEYNIDPETTAKKMIEFFRK